MSKIARIRNLIQKNGFVWTVSHILKSQINEKIYDNYVIWKNKDSLESNNDSTLIDLPSHSVKENKRLWNSYDWSKMGEEWTDEVEQFRGLDPHVWKNNLINEMMLKYIKKKSIILEIGPGGGRWTEILQKIGTKIILADITQKCLDVCMERFQSEKNLEYKLIKNRLDFITDDSIDYIWSYDVFVHINPSNIANYIEDFKRILKPGGCAIIHHSGTINDYEDKKKGWRSFMGREQFANLVIKNNLVIIEQNEHLVHLFGDIITVFSKTK